MKTITNSFLVLISLAFLSSAKASVIYTDRLAWESAVNNFQTEYFNEILVNSDTITFQSNITSTTIGGLSANFVNSAYEFNGGVNKRIGNADTEIDWLFPKNINGFGADFTSIDSDGLFVSGDFDGIGQETINLAPFLSGAVGPCKNCLSGFFGVVGSSSSFDSIIWGTNNSEETFQIDNFSFASAIPVPPTIYLLVVGLLGCFFLNQKVRSSKWL